MSGVPVLRAVEAPPRYERLRSLGHELETTGWAFELFDPDWTLMYVSDEMKALVGEADDAALGCGRHCLATRAQDAWSGILSEESEREWLGLHAPFFLHSNPAIEKEVGAELRHVDVLRSAVPMPPPAVWASHLDFVQCGLSPVRASYVGAPLHENGELIGYVEAFGPSLPASLLPLLVRGNVGMFARMARLAQPRRVEAAILFADLQHSGRLSRRLPSTAFFHFISALTSAMDEHVIRRNGVVGKHAGDGVSAFFLAEDAGSGPAAAAAAVETARAMASAAPNAAAAAGLSDVVADEECALNIGLHWGGALYMGQLVTNGRLEVTALGDEVNECARIQQSARGGSLLASKALVERLDGARARTLGVDAHTVSYRLVEQLVGVSPKAVADAGAIPVTDLRAITP